MGIWPEVAPRLRADHRMILGAVTQRDAAVAVDAVTAHLTDDYPELTSTRAHRTRYLSVAKGSRE